MPTQGALGVDDFMQRLEVALWSYGFQVRSAAPGLGGPGSRGAVVVSARRRPRVVLNRYQPPSTLPLLHPPPPAERQLHCHGESVPR